MAKKFKIGDEEEEGNAEQGEKKADNVVLGQGEGQKKKGGCCGGGKGKQKKVEQSQGEQEEVS